MGAVNRVNGMKRVLFTGTVLFAGKLLLRAALTVMLFVLAGLLLRVVYFLYEITGTVHRNSSLFNSLPC